MLNRYKYLINGLITFTIFTIIALIFKFIPFGGPNDRTMLTIDLGQQYIDFFSLYRRAVIGGEPELILYSFQKGIGGEMIGLWAYYLMSPFNLVLLFFPKAHLALGITFLTIVKLLAASTAFFYFTQVKYDLKPLSGMVFAQLYTFMSYMVVFWLNIMWLDALIFLPILAVGLDKIIKKQGRWLYVSSLALLLMSQYYIGYMVCIFLAFYAVFVIIENHSGRPIKNLFSHYFNFLKYSVMGALMAGVTLLPTFGSLIDSKAAQLDVETGLALEFVSQYNLTDIASKLFLGSYVTDEISSGSPNIYAGMLTLLLVFFFFFNKKIKVFEKITAALIFLMFYLSFSIELFDKLWHGGQFPIWYEFRFSFTLSFFMLVLAIKTYRNLPVEIPLSQIVTALLLMAAFTYYYFQLNAYDYITAENLFVSLVFFVLFLLLVQTTMLPALLKTSIILLLVCIEVGTNAVWIISEMNAYVQPSKFTDYVTTLNEAVEPLTHASDDFYRIHKTYQRTKNEAMFIGYNGLDHFGSTLEAHTADFYGYLGLPNTSNSVNYTNGTLFTDDFFNIRYLLDVSEDSRENTAEEEYALFPRATDLDIGLYPLIDEKDRYITYENQDRLGLAIEVSPDLTSESSQFLRNLPVRNQELLLQLVDFNGDGQPYFEERSFSNVVYTNLQVTDQGDGDFFTYKISDSYDAGYFDLFFSTNSANPYYFSLPSQYSNNNVSLELNEQRYRFYTPANRRQLTNASFNQIRPDHKLRVTIEEDGMQANLVSLYEFDLERYQNMIAQKQDNLFKVTHFKQNQVKGEITTIQEKGYLLFSLPYDRHWTIKLNGKRIEPVAVLNDTLFAIPITQGSHQVELFYFPDIIWWGMFLSVLGLGYLIGEPKIAAKAKAGIHKNSKTQS